MSAFGPKQTSIAVPHMSAFGGKADIRFGARTGLLPEHRVTKSTDFPRLLQSCLGIVLSEIAEMIRSFQEALISKVFMVLPEWIEHPTSWRGVSRATMTVS